jgi:hypothetical protein
MKSFRFYRTERATPPKKTVEEYSHEELEKLQEDFQRKLRRYRRQRKPLLIASIVAIANMFAAIVITGAWTIEWKFVGILVVLFVLAVGAILGFPKCPGCGNERGAVLGPYCPECGSKSVKPGGFPQSAECTICGKALKQGHNRTYRIRFCPICGIRLDEDGL